MKGLLKIGDPYVPTGVRVLIYTGFVWTSCHYQVLNDVGNCQQLCRAPNLTINGADT